MDIINYAERIYECKRCHVLGRVDGDEFKVVPRSGFALVIHDRHGTKGNRTQWRKDLKTIPAPVPEGEETKPPFERGERVRVGKLEALVLTCKKGNQGWHIEVVVNEDLTCPDSIETGVLYRVGSLPEEEVVSA